MTTKVKLTAAQYRVLDFVYSWIFRNDSDGAPVGLGLEGCKRNDYSVALKLEEMGIFGSYELDFAEGKEFYVTEKGVELYLQT